ncbi:MAG: PAS domain S-box protein [Cyclobacteriaceae bacterium]
MSKAARIIPMENSKSVLIPLNDLKQGPSLYKSEDELLLQSISQNINEAIYRSIRGKGLVYINDAFVKMFGYSNEYEILNQSALNLYNNPVEREELAKEIIKHGAVTNKEVEFKRKDGTVFNGSFSSTMVQGNDGVTYFDGAIRDITTRKIAEEQLKYQSEMQKVLISISTQFLNLPFDAVDEVVNATLEELGNFLKVDRLQIHDYDFSRKECITTYEWCAPGIAPTKINSHKISLDSINDMIECHFKGENLFIADVSLLDESAAKKALQAQQIKSVLTVPLILESNCVGFVSLDSVKSLRKYTDSEITMIKLFANMSVNIMSRAGDQQKLQELLETTIVQKKRLKDFSQITSHNVRTSVANLVAINNLLQKDTGNEKYLEYLDTSIDKLNTSIYNINSLLNFDNQYELLHKETCNISQAVQHVLELSSQTIQEKHIEVINRLPKSLLVEAFPSYLDGIFHHLISNALEHGTNKESNKVTIDHSESEGLISVRITDYGRGIDLKRYGKKLFKAGVQFHADNCRGQGMGLFMTNYMIEAMGWLIKAKSATNRGTTFTIVFKND